MSLGDENESRGLKPGTSEMCLPTMLYTNATPFKERKQWIFGAAYVTIKLSLKAKSEALGQLFPALPESWNILCRRNIHLQYPKM